MMLSRVAERLYWMARYLERAEDTARLVNSYSQFVLDIPKGYEPGWNVLLKTIDGEETFDQSYRRPTERNIIKFLIADEQHLNSIRYSIKAARENVRTTRDVLPKTAWELMNELHLFVEQQSESSIARNKRFDFLKKIIACNQQLNGLIATTVTRNRALWFLQLGQLMERSDMTSRIVDVATAEINARATLPVPGIPLLWSNLLHSLSAISAYQREVGPIIDANEVIEFVLKMSQFPRSLAYCTNAIEETIGQLKAPNGMLRSLRSISRKIARFDTQEFTLDELHKFIDGFQAGLADLHDGISDTWFLPPPPT